jgi:type IV secretory pathway TrbD component
LITGLNQAPVTFQAHSWIADGIGIIKWEGDSELINFFAGVNIYPTNTSVIEELYSFKTQ